MGGLPPPSFHLFCLFPSLEELEKQAASPFPTQGDVTCVSPALRLFSKYWLEGRMELAVKRYFPGEATEAERYGNEMAHPFPPGCITEGGQSESLYSCLHPPPT